MGIRRKITWEVNERGCHICTSHIIKPDGYPTLWVPKNKNGNASCVHMHRVLYEEKYGPLDNLVARHKCDETRCINLDHIIPGTEKENSEDMVARNRQNTPRGENRSDTKLTSDDVKFIRSSSLKQQDLADDFGVNQSVISRIKTGKGRIHD